MFVQTMKLIIGSVLVTFTYTQVRNLGTFAISVGDIFEVKLDTLP